MIDPFSAGTMCRSAARQQKVHRLEVDVLHPLPGVDTGVLDEVVLRRADARVVEGDVDDPCVSAAVSNRASTAAWSETSTGHKRSVEVVCDGLPAGRIDVTDDDGGAFGPHPLGSRQPDPARAAGDHGDLARQSLGQIHQASPIAIEDVLGFGE